MLSTPTPARPITRNFEALASSAASTCTAERTSNASASSSSLARLPFSWSGVMTVQSGSRNKSTAEEDIFSAITIFMSMIPLQENDSLQTLQSAVFPKLTSSSRALTGDRPSTHWRWTMKLLMVVLLAATGVGCGYSKPATMPAQPGTMPAIAQLVPPSTAANSSTFTLEVD